MGELEVLVVPAFLSVIYITYTYTIHSQFTLHLLVLSVDLLLLLHYCMASCSGHLLLLLLLLLSARVNARTCSSDESSPVVVITGRGSLSTALAIRLTAVGMLVVSFASHGKGTDNVALFMRGSLTSSWDVRQLLKQAQGLGSLVALVHLSPETDEQCEVTPIGCIADMRDSTRTLLQALHEHTPNASCAPVVVLGSTTQIYERATSGSSLLTESSPKAPSSAFGQAKLAAESVLLDNNAGASAYILRFSNLFGERYDSPYSNIASTVRSFFSRETLIDIDHTDDYLSVADAALFIHRLLSASTHSIGVTALNVGEGKLTSNSGILAALSTMLDRPLPPVLRQIPSLRKIDMPIDVSLTTTLFGSPLQTPLLTALSEYVSLVISHDIAKLERRKAYECMEEVTERLRDLHGCIVHLHEYPVKLLESYVYNYWMRYFDKHIITQDYRCCRLLSTNRPSIALHHPRLKKFRTSSMFQISDFYFESLDKSRRSEVMTIVYNSAHRSSAVLSLHADGELRQVQYQSYTAVGMDPIEFVFGIIPVTCNATTALPFLKRSAGIYQNRGFRQNEEHFDGASQLGLECHRIAQGIAFLQSLHRRLSSLPPLSLDSSMTVDSLLRSSKLTSEHDFSSFVSIPVCDYDCKLKLVCIATPYCKCVAPHICARTAHTIDLQQTESSFDTGSSLEEKVNSISLSSVQLISKERLAALTTLHPLNIFVWNPTASSNEGILVNGRLQSEEPCCQDLMGQRTCKNSLCSKNHKRYNADQILWFTALGAVTSTPIHEADLIFVPFWEFFSNADEPDYPKPDRFEVMLANAAELQGRKSSAKFLIAMTHDVGGCYDFDFNEFTLNNNSTTNRQPSIFRQSFLFNVNADFNTNCFVSEKDIAIAPAACSTLNFKVDVGSIADIVPSVDRRYLLFYAAKYWAYGYPQYCRDRIDYKSLFPQTWGNTTFIHSGFSSEVPNMDYKVMLRHSKFCLALRGLVGWSQRLIEAVYNGCIPVVSIDMLHLHYHDIIDYSSFCIFIEERNIDTIESILLSVTPAAMELMQARVLKLREAFLYDHTDTSTTFTERDDAYSYAMLNLAVKSNTYR